MNERLAVATGKTNEQLAITAEREAEVARLKHALDNAARKHEETVDTMKAKQQGQINDLNAQVGFRISDWLRSTATVSVNLIGRNNKVTSFQESCGPRPFNGKWNSD